MIRRDSAYRAIVSSRALVSLSARSAVWCIRAILALVSLWSSAALVTGGTEGSLLSDGAITTVSS